MRLRAETHSGKVRSMPPAMPMWLRMVKEVLQPRLRRAMHVPFTIATRRLFSGTLCAGGERTVSTLHEMLHTGLSGGAGDRAGCLTAKLGSRVCTGEEEVRGGGGTEGGGLWSGGGGAHQLELQAVAGPEVGELFGGRLRLHPLLLQLLQAHKR